MESALADISLANARAARSSGKIPVDQRPPGFADPAAATPKSAQPVERPKANAAPPQAAPAPKPPKQATPPGGQPAVKPANQQGTGRQLSEPSDAAVLNRAERAMAAGAEDDDPFFAELRDAMRDQTPLGPRDDDTEQRRSS